MKRISTGFQIRCLCSKSISAIEKNKIKLGFMLGNASSPSTFYVHVAPRISSILCPSESNI